MACTLLRPSAGLAAGFCAGEESGLAAFGFAGDGDSLETGSLAFGVSFGCGAWSCLSLESGRGRLSGLAVAAFAGSGVGLKTTLPLALAAR